MKMLAIAQDFGFGPISMLNRAVQNLPDDIEVDFWIPQHLQHVLDSKPGAIINTLPSESEIMKVNLDVYDAAIIACDYMMADAIIERVHKVVIYDMLFWFWPELHEVLNKNILVLAQNFIGVEERAKDYKSVKVVGPLLPDDFFRPVIRSNRSGVLVNFGGFQSPHHCQKEACIYLSNLYPILNYIIHSGYEICIAGGNLILDQLSEHYPSVASYTQKLKHSDIRKKMINARMYLTIPGLGSIYESFFTGVPTYFLPPTNFTQTLQLESIASHIPTCRGFRLPNIQNVNEESYIRTLFKYYESEALKVQEILGKSIKEFISLKPELLHSIAEDGRNFVIKFGKSGEKMAREYVLEYLNV